MLSLFCYMLYILLPYRVNKLYSVGCVNSYVLFLYCHVTMFVTLIKCHSDNPSQWRHIFHIKILHRYHMRQKLTNMLMSSRTYLSKNEQWHHKYYEHKKINIFIRIKNPICRRLFFRHAPNEDLFLLQSQVLQLETQLKQQSSQLQRVLNLLNSVVDNQQVTSRECFPERGAMRRHQSTSDPQIEISEMDTATESFT